MVDLAVYYPDNKLQPPVLDVFKALLPDYGIDNFYVWDRTVDPTTPTLILGNIPEGQAMPLNYVKTISQNQITVKNNAMTEVDAALKRLLKPFEWPDVKIVVQDEPIRKPTLGPVLVVDIETGGDIDIMVSEEFWLLSLAIYDGGDTAYVYSQEALERTDVRQQLLGFFRTKKLIAHNMKFDFRTISTHFGESIFGHLDTMLLHHSINPGAGEHGLKPLCRKYLGAPDWDAGTKEWVKGNYKKTGFPVSYPKALANAYKGREADIRVGFEAIPKDVLYPYNGWDVIWTWRLYEYLINIVKDNPKRIELAKMEFRYGNFFQEVEANGLAVDEDYLDWLDGEIKTLYDEQIAKVRGITERADFNINSPKQVKDWLHNAGLMVEGTAEGVLLDAYDMAPKKVQPFIDALLDARGYSKMHGTYVKGTKKRIHSGLVYSTFKVHGTDTGRLSSANPNVQNLPRDPQKIDGEYPHGEFSIRRIYKTRDLENRILVECDYSQAELRVMACLSQDDYLISLFQPGMPDFFDSLMPTAYPHVDLEALDPGKRKNLRANLKGVIYGLAYGRKAKAIAKALGITVQEAQDIINNFLGNAPKFAAWRAEIERIALDPTRTLETPFGRYYQAEMVSGKNRQGVINSSLSFLPQSTASDLCVNAAIEVHKWIGKEYDGKIIALIHDAILVDVPKEHAQAVGERIQFEMEESGKRIFHGVVPFSTEFTMGPYWEGI